MEQSVFLKGISFEEDPFAEEEPEETRYYDLSGSEVSPDEAK